VLFAALIACRNVQSVAQAAPSVSAVLVTVNVDAVALSASSVRQAAVATAARRGARRVRDGHG